MLKTPFMPYKIIKSISIHGVANAIQFGACVRSLHIIIFFISYNDVYTFGRREFGRQVSQSF